MKAEIPVEATANSHHAAFHIYRASISLFTAMEAEQGPKTMNNSSPLDATQTKEKRTRSQREFVGAG